MKMFWMENHPLGQIYYHIFAFSGLFEQFVRTKMMITHDSVRLKVIDA